MPTLIYPNAGSLKVAEVMRTALADAELRLFKAGAGIVLQPTTTLAQLAAAEADYTGYSAATIAAWLPPLLSPLGGASIESGTVQFQTQSPYTVGNTIQGWYLVDGGGGLIVCGDFPQTIAMLGNGDGIPMNLQLVFGG